MFRKTIFTVAAIAASLGMIVGMTTVPYGQTPAPAPAPAPATHICNLGQWFTDSRVSKSG